MIRLPEPKPAVLARRAEIVAFAQRHPARRGIDRVSLENVNIGKSAIAHIPDDAVAVLERLENRCR